MSAYSDKVIADGAFAYWRLDESSGNVVSKVGGFTGTVSGGVTRNQVGALSDGNSAMLFDGVAGAKIQTATVTLPVACSVELWIKLTTVNQKWCFSLQPDTNVQIGVFSSAMFISAGAGNKLGVRLVNNGVWHHIVLALTGSQALIYVDGMEDAVHPNVRTAQSGPVRIGYDQTFNISWDGLIDEVAIYPTTLSAAQIQAHYSLRNPLPASPYAQKVITDGAMAYWRLGETSGTTALSTVGNFPGTISGGVTLNQQGALSDGNTAMAFDGSTGKIADGIITLPASYSIELWLKTIVIGQRPAFSNRIGGNSGELFFGTDGNSKVFSYFGAGAVTGLRVISDGAWHHAVLVVTNKALAQIYVDGVFESSSPLPDITMLVQSVNIGFDLANNQFWNGTIDEVAIYHTALTPQQIAEHFFLSSYNPVAYIEALPVGAVVNMPRLKVFAMPTKQVLVTANAPLEYANSVDGPWGTSGKFVRCATADTPIICKSRR